MRCPKCGSDIGSENRFCPRCGTDVTRSAVPDPDADDTAPLPVIDLPEDALHKGALHTQFSDARKSSRQRMPLFLFILMLILFLLAFATLAVATYIFYENYVAPYFEQREEAALVEDAPAEQDEGEAQNFVAAPVQQDNAPAQTTAPQTPQQAPAAAAPAPVPAPAPQTPVATEDDPTKQAVYNDVLAAYRDSQEQNWDNALDSDLQDLSSLGAIVATQEDMNVSLTYDQLMSGTVSYAYADFGDDDQLDLAIASVQADGTYALIALYTPSEDEEPTSVMNGAITTRASWKVLPDLCLERSGAISAWEWEADVYQVVGSELIEHGAYGYDDTGYYKVDADGVRTAITWEEYSAFKNGEAAQLDWQPLDAFEEVEAPETSDAGDKDADTAESGGGVDVSERR